MAHWLLKSEPEAYSIDDLEREGVACWDGVRNHQAKNNLRAMAVGDQALFYHSNAKPPGVVGICEVVKEAYPDHTAWDEGSKYFDERSTPEDPRWWMPDVRFVRRFARLVPIQEIRDTEGLEGMVLVKRPRLSVQPVTDEEWAIVCELGDRDG